MKFFSVGITVLIVMLSNVGTAEAWGKYGHMTICELAYRQFTEDTRKEVNRLLTARNEILNPRKDTTSFNYACLYADKNDTGQREHPDEHYANYSRSTLEITSNDCPGTKPCIFEGIDRDFTILKDKSANDVDRAEAMLLLGHWVGDIHQPLHISFSDDRGGNYISKKNGGRCKGKTLHAVWDVCIQEVGIFKKVLDKNYFIFNRDRRYSSKVYDYADLAMEKFPHDEVAVWLETEPYQWAATSYEITLNPDTQYCIRNGADCVYEIDRPVFTPLPSRPKPSTRQKYEHNKKVVINDEYIDEFAPLVEELMFQSSARLAHMMNTALDDNYVAPQ